MAAPATDTTRRSFATVGDNTIDEYVTADGVLRYVGGNALNVAVNLRRLDRACRYAGAIGPDPAGQDVRSALEVHGVVTDLLRTLPGRTSVSRITVDSDGERHFDFEDFAVCADYRPDAADIDRLARCAVVHIGWLQDAASVRARLAAHGVLVSQDCAVTPGFRDLSIAFCSAGDDLARGRQLAAEAVAGGTRLAVATCGSAGSIAFDGSVWITCPAEPVSVVDTTGAGDSYIAGFLASYADDLDVTAAMASGSKAAAATVQRLGSWPQDPLSIE